MVVRIGREGVTTQYIGLVDPAAAEAAVPQTYSVSAITACIDRCDGAELAEFLVTVGLVTGAGSFAERATRSLGQPDRCHGRFL